MTTKKKPINKNPKIQAKKQDKKVQPKQKLTPKSFFQGLVVKNRNFMSRRPHRSFRRTLRRDSARSLALPGYWAFTSYVHKILWSNKKIFLLLTLTYALITSVMVGMASQDTYTTLTDTLRDTGTEIFSGNMGELGKAGLLFVTAATGGLSQTLTEVQQVYAGLLAILTWLTTVWLLRNILAGRIVKLRDGLYSASSPLLSTVVVVLVLIIQLLPLAIAVIGYSAALSSGLLSGGVEAMLFWIAAGLLALLSLYFVTSTFIALVVVTLPGMYPFRALKTAGDLVVGRRVRILMRVIWMALAIALTWILVLIPVILFDTWVKGFLPAVQAIPTIPLVLLGLTSLSVIWSASYIYLLYRKVVSDDALPA